MNWLTSSCSIVNLPNINTNKAKRIIKSDLPIGLIPQVFELYNWLQRSGFKNIRKDDYDELGYSGIPNLDDIEIPDNISWNSDIALWTGWELVGIPKTGIILEIKYRIEEIQKYRIEILLKYEDDIENSYIFTEKDILNLPGIEKQMEKFRELNEELSQGYKGIEKSAREMRSEILARYK